MVQAVALGQAVARAVPLMRIEEAAAPEPATKFLPCNVSGKLSAAPAITLDGSITWIVGPLVMATMAVADFVASARLVAIMDIALGDGATVGAE